MAAVSFVLFSVVIFGATSLYAGAPDEGKVKTVEQVKKNIQVLKGLPASQLDPVMGFMATSLGVRCNHCHVVDSTGWQFDKDDKREKGTARKMLQMVMDLNAKSFGGRTEVTCYTCHHGSTDPVKMPTLPVSQPKQVKEEERTEQVLPSVDQVIAMYEKALGGADAIKKVKSRVAKGLFIDSQGREQQIEVTQMVPDKYLSTIMMKDRGELSHGYNGTMGWMSSPRGSRELPPEQTEELKQEAQLFPLAHLRELSAKLHVRFKDTVNGSMAYILSARVDEHTAERYYIDSASGLLVRSVVMTETMIANIPEQVDYSDYRDVNGVKVPFAIQSAAIDPHDGSIHRFSSIEQNVSVDEKKFTMPKGKK
jgi:hypothetical protein